MSYNKVEHIKKIREKLKKGKASIGSWMQIPHPSVAEIMGDAGFDWVAVDMEHGSMSLHQLPDIFRALELGSTLPLVRVPNSHAKYLKDALDAGAAGVIVPMIESKEQLEEAFSGAAWPPVGKRGVGFSRANLYGKRFASYAKQAQAPFFVAMIESKFGVEKLKSILSMKGLDALLIGPYDLSASLGITAQFEHTLFKQTIQKIKQLALKANVPLGLHVVQPSPEELASALKEGFRFIPYSLDSVMLQKQACAIKWGTYEGK